MRSKRSLLELALILTVLPLTGAVSSVEERLEQQRNLGKAFFENPTTQNEAVAEFKKALDLSPDSAREKLNYALALLHAGKAEEAITLLKQVQRQDPKLPHTWFNLGIYYRKNGDAAQAMVQFTGMLRLTPDEPIPYYQLGALYRQSGKAQEAIAEFERASKLDPLLAGAHFQLYNLYRQAGRQDEAAAQLKTFQELKKQQETSATPEDVDWCAYAEVYDPPRTITTSAGPAAAPTFDDMKLTAAVDAATAGLQLIDATGKGQTDLLAWSSAGLTLYRAGTAPVPDAGFGDLKGVLDVSAGDFDNDGLMDLCIVQENGPSLYRNTGNLKFVRGSEKLPAARFIRAVWIDYDHDYDLDLLLLGPKPALFRNEGTAGFADRSGDFPFIAGQPTDAYKLRVMPDSKAFDLAVFYRDHAPVLYRDQLGGRYQAAAYAGPAAPDRKQIDADLDGDGRIDRVEIAADGSVHLRHNTSKQPARWIRVQLAGIRSLKTGQDAEIELKAGQLYRKQMYEGVPVTFNLADYPAADVVRITWMNGLIQNETKQAAGKAYRYEESQRLSGSCPMVWTWDGKGFRFITDVLGVAPLGASDGEGSYFPVDHDEYVSIPGDALKLRNNAYEVRITEELSEVSYLDQVELIALDYPASAEIYTNEKFKAPPYPEFRLYAAENRILPVSAKDDKGRDVLRALRSADAQYVDGFLRQENGIAARHSLELDFGDAVPNGHGTLFLTGWVDWPDGSTFRAASQELRGGLITPTLEMQNANGVWKVVNPDMGMPAGKPKTIAVDLAFISSSRKLRITTNLCVYWDQIFLSRPVAPRVRQTAVPMSSADLHFRGFSQASIDPRRLQPDTYTYEPHSSVSFWNPTPGNYTRFGDVRSLLGTVDDRLAIMGSGDEITLRFDASALPLLAARWTRDFLLKVDGWAKDRDANTAYSSTVEPLPFHGMSVYPYASNRHFPADRLHRNYLREYNTRPALRLIRPLEPPSQRPSR